METSAINKPRDGALAEIQDNGRRHQRPERLAEISAHLEQRLRQSVTPARRHPGDAGGFGMKDRRTQPDET